MLDDMMTEEFAVSMPESKASLQETPCEVEREVNPRSFQRYHFLNFHLIQLARRVLAQCSDFCLPLS